MLSAILSYLQTLLQRRAGLFFLAVKGVGVDVQRGGDLRVAQKLRHGGHVRAGGDQKACVGVAQGMDGFQLPAGRTSGILSKGLPSPGKNKLFGRWM